MKKIIFLVALIGSIGGWQCKKSGSDPTHAAAFRFISLTVNDENKGFIYTGISGKPVLSFTFSDAIDQSTVAGGVKITLNNATVPYISSLENSNTTLVVQPTEDLESFTKYAVTANGALKSEKDKALETNVNVSLTTGIDSTDKFTQITDEQLLDLVQKQTFKYFWDFGHPVSGLARERNTSGDVVTSGGSGFGIMSIVTAVNRNFITREDGLARMVKIVGFLKNIAQKFHGAFPHWLNGNTGEVVPFSDLDNGADLVETSFLMQGLLTARQYFDGAAADETSLRDDINSIWNGIEWDWFRNGNQDVLYWHWSPVYNFQINHAIRGWNECLITYVLAASSTTHSIPKTVYDNGWAQNGAMQNNLSYYDVTLPLGPELGGPLFFAHYSFLGIDPHDLTDAYANYWDQNVAHTLINYNYCVDNPGEHVGYSPSVWGLTASDDNTGYSAHAPDNDPGVISPTAALSSFPYTPDKSMNALKFFYYKLGDRIWKDYGFVDAFNLDVPWFADSFLAIDQGPIIVMIENYRSGLLWNLFMSCPEVKTGMTNLGFQGPGL